MKSWVSRILVALLITVMTGVVAFAKSKKETVTFLTNIKVNGTLVKKGTYDVSFDEQKAELSVLKNGKVIAKAPTRVEQRAAGKAKSLEIRSSGSGDDTQLVAVTFGGSDQSIVVNQSGGQTTGN